MLHLSGYDLTLQDLQNFRQLDSKTPGHPECFITAGVEVTTGPLGQGLCNAVGIAMASKHTAARFGKPGFESLFANNVYVFCGDGCLMEGVTSEAASLAGHLALDNLTVIYDDNKISIDGNTNITFTEDVAKRFEAYGWDIHWVKNADSDLAEIKQAIEASKGVKNKPHLILARTTIGFGSKNQGSDKVHGAPLGEEEVGNVKAKFGQSSKYLQPSMTCTSKLLQRVQLLKKNGTSPFMVHTLHNTQNSQSNSWLWLLAMPSQIMYLNSYQSGLQRMLLQVLER